MLNNKYVHYFIVVQFDLFDQQINTA